MPYFLFSQEAFQMLSERLSACNRVFKASNDTAAITPYVDVVASSRISTAKHVETLLMSLDAVQSWSNGQDFSDKCPEVVRNHAESGVLKETLGRFRLWLLLRERNGMAALKHVISKKSIERAFPHCRYPSLSWPLTLAESDSLDSVISEERRFASLFSFLLWGCEIGEAIRMADAGRFVMRIERSAQSKETKGEPESLDTVSSPSEAHGALGSHIEETEIAVVAGQSAPIPPKEFPWKLVVVSGVAGVVILFLIVIWTDLLHFRSPRQEVHDFEVSGDGNSVQMANVINNFVERAYQTPREDLILKPAEVERVQLASYDRPTKGGIWSSGEFAGRSSTGNVASELQPVVQVLDPVVEAKVHIRAVVIDQVTQQPVGGALVSLGSGASATTDLHGRVEFDFRPGPGYPSENVTIEAAGYPIRNQEITLGNEIHYKLLLVPH